MNLNNQKINIWDLGDKINIKVNKSFIDFVNRKIKEKFGTKRNIHKKLITKYRIPFTTFRIRMKRGYNYFIDLEILLNICNILKIPLNEFQNNIIAYKTRRGYNYIENPKLPIEITSLFDMLIAHHIGDGNVVNPKRGRRPYFSYRQYDSKFRNLYIDKIKSIFGNLNYSNDYFNNKNTTQIYFPVVGSDIMFKLYNLNITSFLSENARIPSQIFKKDKKFLLAFLIAIIIDEGHVDSTNIVIGLKNKNLIEDLQIVLSFKL